MTGEAGTGATWPLSQGTRRLLELRRQGTDSPLKPLEGGGPANSWLGCNDTDFDTSSPTLSEYMCLSVWPFVRAATGN